MAFERGGIELIVKGFSNFISSMGKANKAYQQMGSSADSAAKRITKAGDRVASAQRSQKMAADNVRKSIESLANAQSKLAIQSVKLERSQNFFKRMAQAFAEGEVRAVDMAMAMEDLTIATEEYNIAVRNVTNAEITRSNALERLVGSNASLANAQQNYNDVLSLGASVGLTATTAMKVLGVAVAGVGIALGVAAAAWNVFKKAIDVAVGVVKKLVDILKSAAQSIMGFFSRALSTAAGFGIYDVFRNITQGISNAVSEIGTAISFFQRLEIQLEALTARDMSNEFGIPVAAAFEKITTQVKELDTWIKNLAVRTPFTAQGIAETLAMANAMGLNIGMSKAMTKATIDFTAAMGLQEDHMFRIIYNFGQMLAQGKLNGREFRDLANSFVPVWEIMRRMGAQVGKTAEEFKKLAFEGGVPVEAFFNEFVKMVEEDFAGAAQKMARTLEGVKNNFRDFMQIIMGTSVLGPVAGFIAERLAKALDILLKPEFRRAAEQIGKAILTSFRMIKNAGDELMSALGGLATAFGLPIPNANKLAFVVAFVGIALRRGIEAITAFVKNLTANLSTSLGSVAGKAASWGYNFVASFANGMAAAINLIVMVINTISRILSSWFKGSSPPRIAKDIDKWGADMISEWVSGWTNFDMSVFTELSSTVESFLRSIAYKIGGKDNVNLIPRILGSREVIAEAINGIRAGLISVGEAAQKVFKQVGNLTSEFKDYIKALFDVEAAQKKVADAAKAIEEAQKKVADAQQYVDYANERIEKSQEELNEITERYEEILERLNDELRKVTDEYDEQRRLKQINAAIGTGLLTDAEKERLEMEKRSIQIKQQIRQVEDERDAATGAVEDKIKAYEAERDAAQARVDALEDYVEQLEKAEEAAQDELDAAQDRLELIKATIDEQIKQNDLVQEQIELLKQLAEAAKSGGGGGGMTDMLEGLGGAAGVATDKVKALSDSIRQFRGRDKEWINQPSNIAKAFADATKAFEDFELALGNLNTALSPLTGEGGALGKLSTAFGTLFGILTPQNLGAMQQVNQMPSPISHLADSVIKLGGAVRDYYLELFALFATIFNIPGDTSTEKIQGFIDKLTTAVGWATLVIEKTKDTIIWFQTMRDTILTKLLEIESALTNFALNFILIMTWLWYAIVGGSIVPEMMDQIYSVISTRFNDALAYVRDTWVVQTLSSILIGMQDMYDTISTKMDEIVSYWTTKFQEAIDFLKDPVGTTIQSTIDTTFTNLKTFFEVTLPTAIQTAKDKLGEIRDKIATDVTNAFNTFKDGPLVNLVNAWEGLRAKLAEVWDWIGQVATAIANFDFAALAKLLGFGGGGKAAGGPVVQGGSYIVGEAGREMFVPAQTGLILPNWMTERLLAPPMASSQNTNTYITNVEINPSYKNVQSEASLYYDVTAALAAARR